MGGVEGSRPPSAESAIRPRLAMRCVVTDSKPFAPSIARELFALGLALASGLAAVGLMVGSTFMMGALQNRFTPHAAGPLPIALVAPGPMIDAAIYTRGRDLFVATCTACHGPKGRGVPGLGKDLTASMFVCEQSDSALTGFIRRGRAIDDALNTTKVPMPPLGGNPQLSTEDLEHIVAFVRGLQDPRRAPSIADAPVMVHTPTEAEKSAALVAAGGDPELAGYIAHGGTIFGASCAACHGKDAHGMKGLGKDLTTSEFARKLDDDGLLAFLLKGRDPSDPLNTTKVAMPPKGGNPALSEDDLLDVIAYLRSISKSAGAPAGK